MANKLRPREVYEDFFHDIICKMLPKFKRSNIRPTYQKNGGKALNNIVVDGGVVGAEGFQKGSNIIYLTVIFDTDTFESFTYEDGSVDVTRGLSLKLNIYGDQSQEVALILFSLFRQNQFLMEFESNNIALSSIGDITQFIEPINGEFWERRDLTIKFNENVSIPVPNLNKVVVIDDTNIILGVDNE